MRNEITLTSGNQALAFIRTLVNGDAKRLMKSGLARIARRFYRRYDSQHRFKSAPLRNQMRPIMSADIIAR